jgi:CBS domain containing-hemolysin-like protein
MTCRDVMVPRTEVVAIEVSAPLPQILQLIAEENHSRIPVFKDDIDHIIGILHVRDIVPMVQHPELILLADLLRPVAYVPWVKPIGDLLREMQKERIHMAVVVDEYGGLAGIVTLEDILREIVGDIGDEFEEREKSVEKQADDSFLVDAMLPVEDFARAFDFKFPEGEFETLGGFLGHLAGALPEVNDRFTHNGWTFVVYAKDGPRLERVKVVKPRPPPGPPPGPEARSSYDGLQPVKA